MAMSFMPGPDHKHCVCHVEAHRKCCWCGKPAESLKQVGMTFAVVFVIAWFVGGVINAILH